MLILKVDLPLSTWLECMSDKVEQCLFQTKPVSFDSQRVEVRAPPRERGHCNIAPENEVK